MQIPGTHGQEHTDDKTKLLNRRACFRQDNVAEAYKKQIPRKRCAAKNVQYTNSKNETPHSDHSHYISSPFMRTYTAIKKVVEHYSIIALHPKVRVSTRNSEEYYVNSCSTTYYIVVKKFLANGGYDYVKSKKH